MPILLFTVNPTGVGHLHDLLSCLAKFNEDVSLEATPSELRISSLNTSKTAYAAFTLIGNRFFDKYHFQTEQRAASAPKAWACKLQNRALASVFRRRLAEGRDKDTGVERCEFELQARADLPECRIIIRLICHLGVVKTYRFTYETGETLHASFDKLSSTNHWTISSKTLVEVVEYFGPKTEQLDWYLQDGKVTFTSYTDKIQSGREILKQPMHTSVALEKQDFDSCQVEEGLHIGIIVKDFRAIVAHASTLHANISARYSRGNKPLQMSYGVGGLQSEFTLMTRSTSGVASSGTTGTPARDLSVQPRSQTLQPARAAANATVQPVMQPNQAGKPSSKPNQLNSHESPPQPNLQSTMTASINPDSLFIPADDDDDRQWDEPNYDDEGQDFVTWDASASVGPANSVRRVRDSEQTSFASAREHQPEKLHEIAPTQRLSQMKGLFD